MINKSGTQAIDLTESQIRYAMENSKSNAAAAAFLGVNYLTYRKYARMYRDSATGETLFELHKNQGGKNISKGFATANGGYVNTADILRGFHPDYPPNKIKDRLIKEGFCEEKCAMCNFSERRVVDYSVPLKLDFIDGDKTNHLLSNLRLLCYNCYFLTVGNIVGRTFIWDDF